MAAVATIASPPEQRVLLSDVSWSTYESLLADHVDRRVPRFVYDQGVLEIVSPSPKHEEDALALAGLVELVAEEWGIDFRPMGSTTYRRAVLRQGFEADASFYIQNERFARDLAEVDPTVDPPPDLVIGIDVGHPSLDKLPIYAGMGVAEVWRCHGDRVTILVLEGDRYRESPASLALPLLTTDILTRFVVAHRSQRRLEWIRAVRAWAREQRAGDAATE